MSEEEQANAALALKKAKALQHTDVKSAIKWCEKSCRLYRTSEAEKLLIRLRNSLNQQQQPKHTPRAPSHGTGASRPAPAKKDTGASFTTEQRSIAVRITKTTNYYEILGVSRTATDKEITKAYRKLSMKLHPDKNKAPEAEEAFKVINKAHTCLTDSQQRRHYDMTGEESQSSGGGGGGSAYSNMYSGGVDPTFEDIFNNVFMGGMGGMGGRHGGGQQFFYRSYGTGFNNRSRRPNPRHTSRSQSTSQFGQFVHFLPIILLLLFTLLSSSGTDTRAPFSLHRDSAFSVRRETAVMNTPYFVEYLFDRRYGRDPRALAQVERSVEEAFYSMMSEKCNEEKKVRKNKIKKAKTYTGTDRGDVLDEAYSYQTKSCEIMEEYERRL